jgi:probable HAF family extracellular repeat protein
VNNAGQIIGTATNFTPGSPFFLETNGVFSQISLPASLNPNPVIFFVSANAINNKGEIVGAYWMAGGPDGITASGFLDDNGLFTPIQFPGAADTTALGINDSGEIVGTYADSAGVPHGFLDNNGSFTAIDFPGARYTVVSGINNAGEIVGTAAVPEPAAILLVGIGIVAIRLHFGGRRT